MCDTDMHANMYLLYYFIVAALLSDDNKLYSSFVVIYTDAHTHFT